MSITIGENRVVKIDYIIRDEAGNELESADGELMSYIHGIGVLAPGLERALEGRTVDSKLVVTLPPEEAFGIRDDDLVITLDLDDFDDPEEVTEGLVFHADIDGTHRLYTVLAVEDGSVTVDGNHPFADRTLTFDVTVKEVREATPEELEHGHVHGEHGHHH